MEISRISSAALLGLFLLAWRGASASEPATCTPPLHFVDVPHPQVAPMEQLVTHTEKVTIERPLEAVLEAQSRTTIEQAIARTASLPHVSGTYMLKGDRFGDVGTRRLTCLTDGSTAEEEVLETDRTDTVARFRYVVWNYTTKVAQPVSYGVGYFERTALPGGRTQVRWTYGFELKRDRFPGDLGGLGRVLFRVTFLDRQYADLMRATLALGKANAESATERN